MALRIAVFFELETSLNTTGVTCFTLVKRQYQRLTAPALRMSCTSKESKRAIK